LIRGYIFNNYIIFFPYLDFSLSILHNFIITKSEDHASILYLDYRLPNE